MPKKIAKKTIILYVLKMLQQGSSKEPITQTNMAKVLNSMGVPCDRKTIGRNIDYLIEFGFPIVKIKGGGCYIDKK